MKKENKSIKTKDELLSYLKTSKGVVEDEEFGALFITAGAGDIDTLVDPVKQIILNKN